MTDTDELDLADIAYIGQAPLVPTRGPERILLSLRTMTKPLADLEHWPGNANIGDQSFIAESLQTNGQFRPILIQKSTGRVVYGNHTLRAARDDLHWTRIAQIVEDLTDEQARRIALADNEAGRRGQWDNEALVAELQQLTRTDHDLVGTGFDRPALDGLLEQLQGAGGAAGPISAGDFADKDASGNDEIHCPNCGHTFNPETL